MQSRQVLVEKLRAFAPQVRCAAADLAYEMLGVRTEAEKVKLPSRNGCAVPIGAAAIPVDEGSKSWNKHKIDGIVIFSGKYTVKNGSVEFEISEELLRKYAEISLQAFGPVRTAERIAIPGKGISADEEAAAYAAALLNGRGKTGKAFIPTLESRNALLRCLLLMDREAKRPRTALASAVRASLEACFAGAAGGAEALAMARLLSFAESDL